VELPVGKTTDPVAIRAAGATHWRQGAYEVWVLRGDVRIDQGSIAARGEEAVLWVDRAEAFSGRPSKVIAYLEGKVVVDFGRAGDPHSISRRKAQTLRDRSWIGRFHTTAGIELSAPPGVGQTSLKPAIYARGVAAHQAEAGAPAGFSLAGEAGSGFFSGDSSSMSQDHLPGMTPDPFAAPAQFTREEIAPPAGVPTSPQQNRVSIFGRSGGRFTPRSFVDPERNERLVLITQGVQIIIRGIDALGTVSIEADRVVTWVPGGAISELGQTFGEGEGPLELYLEGNIVFRQGDRVIYADRMYYNVRQEYGVVLNAELLTPVPEYQGLLRLRAEVLQQVNRQHFEAYNAALTSSRIGVPRYWFQAQNVSIDDIQTPLMDPFTNQPLVDPASGELAVEHQYLATSRSNFVYLAGVPVFYWPVIATDLSKPTYYLDSLRVKSDGVFGTQFFFDWDLYQLLGIEGPPGTRWSLSTDYLSDRGPALGTNFQYEGDDLLLPGRYRGFIDAWGIYDEGLDNLGRDRLAIEPETDFRGRVLAQHRQWLPGGWDLLGQFGVISDRNFLEQYYELEWDTLKDQITGLELRRLNENRSWSIAADVRLNDFFTQTQQLPRIDHFWLGQPLLFDRLTWFEHTTVGYLDLQPATPPESPLELAKWSPLPWEADRQGVRAATRQEIDLPLEVGPTRFVPYLLGEAAYWGDDLTGEDVMRTYYQAGVRASTPVWRADPTVNSELFNLRGLSHKISYEAEAFFSEASEDLGRFPLYEPLDDDVTEAFRRRMAVNTFNQPVGTFVPLRFDERTYALRRNLQGNVTGPTEIADDLTELRVGINQRWQTKRGLPGQERIIDWIVLDLGAVYFPQPERDNFGEELGLIDYDFQWHVGDRLTLLSDGFYDVFSQGLRQTTVAALLNRPQYGSLYVGVRSTEGPITSNIVAGSLSYRMSDKWIGTAGASWDLSSAGNIGQNVALTRIGESFLMRVGFNYDASRENFGVSLGLEPRFLPSARLGRVGGVQIPPAGALGLE
jgi:hypothetical protein